MSHRLLKLEPLALRRLAAAALATLFGAVVAIVVATWQGELIQLSQGALEWMAIAGAICIAYGGRQNGKEEKKRSVRAGWLVVVVGWPFASIFGNFLLAASRYEEQTLGVWVAKGSMIAVGWVTFALLQAAALLIALGVVSKVWVKHVAVCIVSVSVGYATLCFLDYGSVGAAAAYFGLEAGLATLWLTHPQERPL
jgi:hypothetical protein